MKRNVKHQIIAAVMAVLLTAGLGTAALASSEPTGEPPAGITQWAENDHPDMKPSEAPAIPDGEQPGKELDQQPSSEPNQQPSAEPNQQPSAEPDQQPSAEPNQQPSAEPGQQPGTEPDRSSGEKDRFDIRSFLQELIGKLQALLGFGQKQDAPALLSPTFEPNADAPSGEMNVPGEALNSGSRNDPAAGE